MRPTLKIFLFPLTRPCFTSMGRSVRFFFNFSNLIPINLIVNSPSIGTKIKYTNNLLRKMALFKLDNSLSLQ